MDIKTALPLDLALPSTRLLECAMGLFLKHIEFQFGM